MSGYQFSDSDLAARRLEYLAGVYDASSAEFIRSAVTTPVRRAVDLGCGPGHTTLLLASCARSRETYGLDSSSRFVALAQDRWAGRAVFRAHDVTVVPFPVPPADILYCRLLLSHMTDPSSLFDAWASQLEPGGRLLVEEVEWIETADLLFRQYLQMVDTLLARQGQRLYVGPLVHAAAGGGAWRRRSAVVPVDVKAEQAATMFWMNIRSWRRQPLARAIWSEQEMDELEQNLGDRALGRAPSGAIRWGFRRMALERTVAP